MSISIHYLEKLRMSRLHLIVYGVLLLCSSSVRSQNLQLAGFSVTRLPGSEIVGLPLNQKIETNEFNFFINIPKPLKNEKTIIINGLKYRLITPFVDNEEIQRFDGQNLHLISYQLTIAHKLANQWLGLIVMNPTLSSTFNTSVERDDVIFPGAVQFIKNKSDNFSYGFGIARTARFGEALIIPTLQLTKSYQKSTLKIVFPRQVSFDYHFEKFDAGLQFSISGSEYNANYSITTSSDIEQPIDRLAYSRIILGPRFSFRVGKILLLEASGGFATARSIDLRGDQIEDEKYDIKNGAFFQFGVALVPPKKR